MPWWCEAVHAREAQQEAGKRSMKPDVKREAEAKHEA